ncbi:MAG TPA: pitrilysin family protein [Candidatus Hydrogenedentes bacterium]|nr:pitrilysin family protein [Candidatus Hydrogenedentota bacterium]HOL76953.1 pitrilysin family protein [Candidatus Hydrogenedentota bacterium]HPO86658.1 pitrilysin family protein [Candidatus Hydrogenedentota bacterium]
MSRWRLGSVLLIMCSLGAAEDKTLQLYPFQEHVLSNGLRVITLEDFSCPIVAVQVWYHVGSKDEHPDRQGFAHMFEHMMFRGTDLLGPEGHFDLIRRTGGYANAFTSFDYTAYVNVVPSNQLELALWLEADRMMFLKIDEENFTTERQVVIEERRQDLNEPYGTVFEQIMPVVFPNHPYRWLPIGQIEALNAAHADELKLFWDTYYIPANAALVIVGAVKHKEAVSLAEKYFGWMPPLPPPPRVEIDEKEPFEAREITIDEGRGPAPLVRFVYRTVPENHPDYIPLRIAAEVLGGGESSRIYRDLVKKEKICQDASAYLYALEKAGVLFVGAELMPGGDTEPVIAALENHMTQLCRESITERELEKAKNQLRRNLVTDSLTVMDKARQLGQAALTHGSPDWLNRQWGIIGTTTREDVQRVVSKYVTPDRRVLVRVLPKPNAVYVPPTIQPVPGGAPWQPLKQGVARPKDFPIQPPIRELKEALPKARLYTRFLDNGLKIVVVPNDETPFFTMMLGLKEGPWTENPQQPGVASAALEILTQGTEKYTAEELAELLDFHALTLRGTAEAGGRPTMDVGQVAATGLSEKFPLAMELLAEVIRRPTFPEEETNIFKDQRRLTLSVKEKDPRYIADRAIYEQLYRDHPYARPVTGTLKDIDLITSEAMRTWWNTHVKPSTCTLYVAGDVKPKDVMRLAKQFLGDWENSSSSDLPKASIPSRTPLQIFLVNVPGAVQSQIRVAQTSITRGHPDYHNARVFSQIFGSDFNSRLNRVIRIEKGLTYSVWGMFVPQRFSGEFLCSTFTKTESTAETVRALLEVIKGTKDAPPSEDELAGAKSYLVGGFAKQLETPQDFLEYQWMIEYNELPKDYLKRAIHAYKMATIEDMTRVASTLIDPEKLSIVVVGDAERIRKDLESIAPVSDITDRNITE